MTIESHTLAINGLEVEVLRKAIKNLHLGVYPPDGRVRVAVPLAVTDDAVRSAVLGKLRWIRHQRESFRAQPRQSQREMVDGESHYIFGQRYRLELVYTEDPSAVGKVQLLNRKRMQLHVRRTTSERQRERLLHAWYREQLREQAAPMIAKWAKALGVTVKDWGIKQMKTKWGSCTAKHQRIWLNLELAKKAPECLEYLVLHELVHFVVRHHNHQFSALMDRHLPQWRTIRRTLNAQPLGNHGWSY